MTARKRPARKPSNISAAQAAATARRLAEQKKTDQKPKPGQVDPKDPAGRVLAQVQPKPGTAKQEKLGDGKSLSQAANKIAGLASGIMQDKAKERAALADPSLYGKPMSQNQGQLDAIRNQRDQAANRLLASKGNAVYMGPASLKLRRRGPERVGEDGGSLDQVAAGDDVRSKDVLMSWLSDETVFGQIKKRMQDSGLGVATYDDVAKLWEQVVNQAAATYSSTGKKVTPWALLALRGKNMVGGKPASKTTTSTSIDEMDPANAKAMINKLASDALGREATPAEVEDFIAKAQTIVDQNPQVTQTTTNYGVTGDAESQVSHTSGGMSVAMNRAQQQAQDSLNQSSEHADYQAAGVIMPWLEQALSSPF